MELQIRRGPQVLGPFRLADGPNVAGRAEDCDILLPSRRVSRHHCVFELFKGAVTVRDLGSHNGVVGGDGRRVTTLVMAPGDEVLIGDYYIGLVEHELTQSEQLDLDPELAPFDTSMDDVSLGTEEERDYTDRLPPRVRPMPLPRQAQPLPDNATVTRRGPVVENRVTPLVLPDLAEAGMDDLSVGMHLVTEDTPHPFVMQPGPPVPLFPQSVAAAPPALAIRPSPLPARPRARKTPDPTRSLAPEGPLAERPTEIAASSAAERPTEPALSPAPAPVAPAPVAPAAPVIAAPAPVAPVIAAPAPVAPAPVAPAAPVIVAPAPVAPAAPVIAAPAPVAPVIAAPAPVAPAPVAPAAPVIAAPAPVAPVIAAPAPVAPVIAAPAPVAPVRAAPAPVAPVIAAPAPAPVAPAPVAPVIAAPAPVAPVAPVASVIAAPVIAAPAPVAPVMAAPAPVAPAAPVIAAPAPVAPVVAAQSAVAPAPPVAPATPVTLAAPANPAPAGPASPRRFPGPTVGRTVPTPDAAPAPSPPAVPGPPPPTSAPAAAPLASTPTPPPVAAAAPVASAPAAAPAPTGAVGADVGKTRAEASAASKPAAMLLPQRRVSTLPLVTAGVFVALAGLGGELWGLSRVDASAGAMAADVSGEEARLLAGGTAFGVSVSHFGPDGESLDGAAPLGDTLRLEAQERGVAHASVAGGTRAVAVDRDGAGKIEGFVAVDGPPTRLKADTALLRAIAVIQAILSLLVVVAAAMLSSRRF